MIKKKKYPLLSMMLSLLLLSIIFFATGIWPFGDKTIVTGDLGGQYINFYSHYCSAIQNGAFGGLIYGFDKSLGGPLIGNFAYYCTSIFNILYLFFSPDKYPVIVTVIFALKIISASGTMCFFLNKQYDKLDNLSVPLGLCYTFCAFSTVYYQNIMWFDAMIFLPIIAYGINKIINNESPLTYIFFLTLTILSNFYTGYMVCIFSVIYFFYSIILNRKLKNFLPDCLNFGISSLLSGGLSAFLVIPMLADVLKAKGTGFEITGLPAFKFSEFFYRLFPFNFTWENVHDGLPNVYTGTLCLIGVALFVSSKKINIKEKVVTIAVLIMLFFSMYSFDFMVFWHGFKEPVWFPYRNTFIFSFFLCIIAGKALQEFEFSKITIGFSVILLAILICAAFLIRNIWFTLTLLCIGILLMGANYGLVIISKATKYKGMAALLLIIVCCTELAANSMFNIRQFENYTITYLSDFYSDTQTLLSNLSEDNSFSQRIEKTHFRTYNDPMMFGYPGLTHFGSTEDTETNNILKILGYNDEVYTGKCTAFADSFIGLGYLISKDPSAIPEHFEIIKTVENGIISKNNYVFPMVYRISHSADDELIIADNIFETQNNLYTLLGGEGKLLEIYTGELFLTSDGKVALPYEEGFYYYLSRCDYVDNKEILSYEYHSTIKDDKIVFNTVTKDNLNSVKIWKMSADKLLKLSYNLHEYAGHTKITPYSFISEVDCSQSSVYIINLPYSKHLKIMVDNKTAETFPGVGGLTGIHLDTGKHIIEAGGNLVGGNIGVIITLISIAVAIVYMRHKTRLFSDKTSA